MTNSFAQDAESEIRRIREISNNDRKNKTGEDISKYYTEDIIIIKGDGGELNGKGVVNDYMAQLREKSPDLYFERTPDKIVVAGSNKMAWEEGIWKGFNKEGQLPDYGGRYSMMWVNTKEGWKMRSQQFVNLK